MKILGIDPGSNITGWGILDFQKGKQPKYVSSGVFKIPKELAFESKLSYIYKEIEKLIVKNSIEVIAVETQFYLRNVKTLIVLCMVRAMPVVLSAQYNIQLVEFEPKVVKASITGKGNADKEKVRKMINALLKINIIAENDNYDESDALAIAYSVFFQGKMV